MQTNKTAVEQWDVFELTLEGPSTGNPFADVELSATFTNGQRQVRATGFYNGNGQYKIRFMPEMVGVWTCETSSNLPQLSRQSAKFDCIPPTGKNHGPVEVQNTFHFKYRDGNPFRPIGTTAYAWLHQGEDLQEQTLTSLKNAPFNKIRMCVFPKKYAFNSVEPPSYPFAGTAPKNWDFKRFNPVFWHNLEKRILQLRDMEIEVDLILFHPYDEGHWGFDRMDEQSDDRYLKYCLARLSAYRNIWWSMANEFDFMDEKRSADWDRYFQIVVQNDPYNHLRSVHNGRLIYDHNKPWVTHASIQNGSAVEDFGRATLYRDVYYKPIMLDEVKYEGNIEQRWGNISAEEMVHRFWQGTISGTYVTHGETYKHPQDVIWWARGGKLYGQSPARIAFLKKILDESPAGGIDPIDKWQDYNTAGVAGEYYLVYFGAQVPGMWEFSLPRAGLSAGMKFRVEILDTWNMKIEKLPGEFKIIEDATYRYRAEGLPKIKLDKPYMALRVTRVAGDKTEFHEQKKIYGEG